MEAVLRPATASSRWPWLMLPARTLLFIAFQAVFAAGFALAGSLAPWTASAAWWPFTVTFTNLVCLYLLGRFFRQEGRRYWDIFRFDRAHLKGDLLLLLGFLVITGPAAFLPNILLGSAMFGDQAVPQRMLIGPLPLWAAWAAFFFFPITQGLAELPTYFMYSMPEISEQTGRPWLALSLSALALGLQHCAMPLLFDWRFITWRLFMFIPFAFIVGFLLWKRPRLMPYMAAVHIFMDMGTALFFITGV